MSDPVVLLSTGDVVGPAGGVTDNSMVLFSGTSGKLIKGNNAVVTAAGLALLDDVNAAAQRVTLGLGNVDNTSDVNKPISTATQTALDLKANIDSPTFTGVPSAPTASAGTNTQQLASTAFVQAAVGVGNVSSFAMVTPPTGWLKANGATVNRATYAALFTAIGTTFGAGDGSTTFNLPDLRGEFLRGWDDGRGLDANRLFGTAQMDALQGHWHGPRPGTTLAGSPGNWNGAGGGANGNYNIGSTGDPVTDGVNGAPRTAPETRPRNVALLYCIKY